MGDNSVKNKPQFLMQIRITKKKLNFLCEKLLPSSHEGGQIPELLNFGNCGNWERSTWLEFHDCEVKCGLEEKKNFLLQNECVEMISQVVPKTQANRVEYKI